MMVTMLFLPWKRVLFCGSECLLLYHFCFINSQRYTLPDKTHRLLKNTMSLLTSHHRHMTSTGGQYTTPYISQYTSHSVYYFVY